MPVSVKAPTKEKAAATRNSTTGAKALKETLRNTLSNKPSAKAKPTETKPAEIKAVNTKTSNGKTRITVHYNTGFNSSLFIRGSEANLSWDKGVQLKNVDSTTWVWETSAKFDQCEFKILLNDSIYENGPNHHLTAGKQLEHTPKFN